MPRHTTQTPDVGRPVFETAEYYEHCVLVAVLVIRQYVQHAFETSSLTKHFPTCGHNPPPPKKTWVYSVKSSTTYIRRAPSSFFFLQKQTTLRRSWTESVPRLGTPPRRMLTPVGVNSRRSLTTGCSTGQTLSRRTAKTRYTFKRRACTMPLENRT